jgi:2-iminoacetate synthase ThiH
VAPGAAAEALLAAVPAAGKSVHGLERSAVVGVASDWMRASDGDDVRLLVEGRERGIRAISDGVLPAIHPARGLEAGERWASFWRAAAGAGLRGFASLFYGPRHDRNSIADQLEAIAAVQEATEVFLSVCPVVDPGRSFGGLQDSLLTHGDADVRTLAACRLSLEGIEHLTLLYNRTDLKMAHIALLGGVDDLSGHLTLEERGPREDANHDDLSLAEMESWMRDAGMEARLRNACFETAVP